MRKAAWGIAAMLALGGCAPMADGVADRQETAQDRPPLAVPVCPTETRNWTAHVDAMPGPGAVPTLIVQGEALLPERASVTLRAAGTEESMPPAQIVELAVEPSNEAAGWQVARAEIAPAEPDYRAVIVRCDGNPIATISPVETAY